MKKFLVFAMVLISACMVFAAESKINVTTTIKGIGPRVAFTEEAYEIVDKDNGPTQISKSLTLTDITSDIESDRSTTVWISADTNILDPVKISVYGTALTLIDNNIYRTETVPLKVAVDSTGGKNSTSVNFNATFEEQCKGPFIKPKTKGFTLVEGASADDDNTGKAGSGLRPLTWQVKISTEKANSYAGSYEAYLWIDTSVEA